MEQHVKIDFWRCTAATALRRFFRLC